MPTSIAENSAALRVLSLVSPFDGWIGFTDEGNEAGNEGFSFQRVDTDQPIGAGGYTNFLAGEPNDLFGEDCVEMRVSGLWNDDDCRGPKPFVCQL